MANVKRLHLIKRVYQATIQDQFVDMTEARVQQASWKLSLGDRDAIAAIVPKDYRHGCHRVSAIELPSFARDLKPQT